MARIADAVRPRLERATAAARLRITRTGRPQAVRTWQYTAGAATVGLALAAGVVTAAGPWDSTGQRTAERERAAAQERTGGADHGRTSDSSGSFDAAAGAPRPA